MTRDEFKLIAKAVIAAYPRDNTMPNEYTFGLWFSQLSDLEYVDCRRAVQAWINESRWPPTIADIRQKVHDLTAPPDRGAAAQWGDLVNSLRKAFSPDALETWENLPETTRQIVGSFSEFRNWSNIPIDTLESVNRSLFIKRLETMQQENRRRAAIPEQLRTPKAPIETARQLRIEEGKKNKEASAQPPAKKLEEMKKRLRNPGSVGKA